MRFFKKLHFIVAAEICSLTFVIMAAFSAVMFLFRIVRFGEYLFVSAEGGWAFLNFLVFFLPSIFKVTIPISLLIASAVVAVRMSIDRELDAWLAAGTRIWQFCVPALVVGIFFALLSWYAALYGEAYGRKEWLKYRWLHARRSIESLVESKIYEKAFLSDVFHMNDAEISMYVDSLENSRKQLKGVFVSYRSKDERYSSILVGEKGGFEKVVTDGSLDYIFWLQNGYFYLPTATLEKYENLSKSQPSIFIPPAITKGETPWVQNLIQLAQVKNYPPLANWTVLRFENVKISLINLFQGQFDPGEMRKDDMRSMYPVDYFQALRKIRQEPNWKEDKAKIRDHSFFYEQIVVPFACLLLPLMGFLTGILDARKKSNWTYISLSFVIFMYYALIMICQDFAMRNYTIPEMTLIVPPLFIILFAMYVYKWRDCSPPSVTLFDFTRDVLANPKILWRGKK